MSHLSQPIGILGGTFDPVHFGHLRLALEIYEALNLAEVRLIPCYQPVHRKPPIASPTQRLAMVEQAVLNESAFCVDTSEMDRKGPSYTFDTLANLRSSLPNTPFCLIMGIDALLNFTSWHKWEAILQLAHLVVAYRPSYDLPQEGMIAELLKLRLKSDPAALSSSLAGHIFLLPITPLEISSTQIRELIASAKNPRYLLPDKVYEYIKQQNMYTINLL